MLDNNLAGASPRGESCRGRKHLGDGCMAASVIGVSGDESPAALEINDLVGRVVAFTTPLQYASRFEKLLSIEGAEPLWCPTIVTEQSDQTRQEVDLHLGRLDSRSEVHGIAFTSREGIKAFADSLNGRQLPSHHQEDPFIVGALGKDAELLQELNMTAESSGAGMVVPTITTPQGLVEALGEGRGRNLLCPVPLVLGLEEPPVVPQFLAELSRKGWNPVRVNSYVTRWLGPDCAKALLDDGDGATDASGSRFVKIDALVFTSTAEVEGLLKSLESLGYGVDALQRKGRRGFLIAAHGPVTALGAERLGVEVEVVGKDFKSFYGVINALKVEFGRLQGSQTTTVNR